MAASKHNRAMALVKFSDPLIQSTDKPAETPAARD